MIVPDSPHNSNSSNVSLSEAPATAAHGDGSAYEFPPDWIPADAPPMADDWQPETPSRNLDVKGGRLYARPVANSGSLEFAEGLERSGNPLQATDKYADLRPSEPRSAGLPSGEQSALVRAMAADPSRPRIEPTSADYERLSARSVGHRGPAVGSADAGQNGNPRESDTGVVITNAALDIATPAVVDWMSWTVPTGGDATNIALDAADWACWLTGGNDIAELDRGSMGYTHGYRLPGSGLVLYNPDRPDMGIHCVLSSSALGIVPHEPIGIIRRVADCGGKFTRVDVAVDTHEVHISTVDEAIRRGDLVSRATNHEKIQSYNGDGFTIYIGDRTSDRFTRIYNKQAEQGLSTVIPKVTPAQVAVQEAQQVLQDARAAVLGAKNAKKDAEQVRKSAVLSWVTSRLGTDKEVKQAARQERREAQQAKRDREADLLQARRTLLAAQVAVQEAQQVLQDERQNGQDGQDGQIWTRAEVEFKGKQAQIAASYILQGVDLRSLVFSAIDFRDRAADSNTSRCPRLEWWERWIGAVDRVSFAVKTVEKTVVQVYEWVQRQVAPALSFLDEFFGTNQGWLQEICNDNKDRIPTFRQRMIESTPPPKRLEMAKDAEQRVNRWALQIDGLGIAGAA